jgi:hypothetical protein
MAKKQPPNPVTQDDAALFSDCVKKWQHVLGMHDWRIAVSPRRSTRKVMAEVFKFDLEQRSATIRLGKDWGPEPITPDELDKTALHEVLHVFLHELIETAKVADQPDDVISSAEHRCINLLEQILPLAGGKP